MRLFSSVVVFLPLVAASPAHFLRRNVANALADICGTKGYDMAVGAYLEVRNSSGNTQAACASLCLKDPKCLSFAFGSRQCYLYTGAVAGNFETEPDSPYQFYDRGCIASAAPPVATQPAPPPPPAPPIVTSTPRVTATATTRRPPSGTTAPPIGATGVPGTTTASSVPTGAAQHCGVVGYDKAKPSAYDTVTSANLATCASHCKESKDCLSYSFGSRSCNLYSVAVDVTNNLEAEASSPYKFYDVGCSLTAGTATRSITSTSIPAPVSSPSPTMTRQTTAPPRVTTSSTVVPAPPVSTPRTTTSTTRTRPIITRTTSSTPTAPTPAPPKPVTPTTTSSSLPAAPTTPSGPLCGMGGWSAGNTTFFDSSGTYNSQASCYEACKARSCGSYGFGSGTCLVFTGSVTQSITTDPNSIYKFWDVVCPIVAVSPAPAASATKSRRI